MTLKISNIRISVLRKKSEIDPSTLRASYDSIATCNIKYNDILIEELKLTDLSEEDKVISVCKAMYEDLKKQIEKKYDSIGVWFTLTDTDEVIDNAIDILTLNTIEKNREDLNGFEEFIRLTYKNII